MVGGCGAQRPPFRIVGQFDQRTGRDGKKSSVLVLTQDGRTGPLGTKLQMHGTRPSKRIIQYQYSGEPREKGTLGVLVITCGRAIKRVILGGRMSRAHIVIGRL